MDDVSEDFLVWAEDPSRSVEERYCIVRLTEYYYRSMYRGPDKVWPGFEQERDMREDRCYDPGYDPVPDPVLVRQIAEVLPTLEKLELETHLTDRPIRDLSVLAFMPKLQSLKLRDIEINRLEVLRHVPDLRDFNIRTDGVEDYRDLALCRELRSVQIQTWHPWPILDGLETLPHLERLVWLSNGRSLAGIAALPRLKSISIDWAGHHSDFANCVKDLHQLPEMPLLETLWGGCFYRLDGIGRFPHLRLVCIKGYFKSLTPLAELKEVSHLRVVSPRIEEVATIAGMPSVFQFAIKSVRPQDWSPLFESETLWDVYQDGCEAPQPDYHTLRMLLPPQAEFFGSAEPRPKEPLRFRIRAEGCPPTDARFPDGPEGWDGFLAMRQSEVRWVEAELTAALRKKGFLKLQGVRFDKDRFESHHIFHTEPPAHAYRQARIRLLRTEAIGRVRGIVECMRTVLLRTRYPWQVHFMLTPEADADEWDDSWRNEDTPEQRVMDMIEEEREVERANLRRRLFLKDEQRMRLLRELGHDTAEFRRSELPPEEKRPEVIIRKPPKGEGKEKDNDKKGKGGDSEDGGIAEADPDKPNEDESWLAPVEINDPNVSWNRLFLMFTMTSEAVWVGGERKDAIEALSYLLDLPPEYPEGFNPETAEDDC